MSSWPRSKECGLCLFLLHHKTKTTYGYCKAKLPTSKAKKRTREDDIPPSPSDGDATQLKAYKQLEGHTRCELHRGHCFVDRTSGYDNHRRLDHAEMTLWAKKIVSLTSMHSEMIHNATGLVSWPCDDLQSPSLSQLRPWPEQKTSSLGLRIRIAQSPCYNTKYNG